MRICNACILPETFRNLQLDNQGVCSYCNENKTVAKNRIITMEEKMEKAAELDRIIEEMRGRGLYDCVVGFSGGKDSTYLLWKLKEEYKLKVLAVTIDHGYMPDITKENISKIPKQLGIDFVQYEINADFMNKFFKYKFENYTKAKEAVFDHMCADCSNILEGNVIKFASALNIPLVFIGLSPEQVNRYFYKIPEEHLMKSWLNDEFMDDFFTYRDRMYCWNQNGKNQEDLTVVFPFHVWPYDEEEIVSTLEQNNILSRKASNPLKTRCKILDTMCYIDKNRLGYDPFMVPFADLIRTGKAPREKYYNMFYEDDTINMDHVDEVVERLNLDMHAIINK